MAEQRGAGIAGVAAALLFTIAGPSSQAETSAAPVYVSIQDSIGASTPHTAAAPPIVGGLVFDAVAWLASRGVNKQSAVKVDRFNKSIGSFDFAAEARRAFGCADPNECHEGMAFTDPELFQAAFDRNPAHRHRVAARAARPPGCARAGPGTPPGSPRWHSGCAKVGHLHAAGTRPTLILSLRSQNRPATTPPANFLRGSGSIHFAGVASVWWEAAFAR
jgi:hypothetical protein